MKSFYVTAYAILLILGFIAASAVLYIIHPATIIVTATGAIIGFLMVKYWGKEQN